MLCVVKNVSVSLVGVACVPREESRPRGDESWFWRLPFATTQAGALPRASSLNTWERTAMAGSHVLRLKPTVPGIGGWGGGGRGERGDERRNVFRSGHWAACVVFNSFSPQQDFRATLLLPPWVRKISWRRKWDLLQYCCLGNPMPRRAWRATVTQPDWATEHARTITSGTWAPHLWLLGWRGKGEGEENLGAYPALARTSRSLLQGRAGPFHTPTLSSPDQLHASLQDAASVLLPVLQTHDSPSGLWFCQTGAARGSQQPVPFFNLGRRKGEIYSALPYV